MEMLLVKSLNRLAAAEPISQELIEGMRQGEIVTATIKRTRNVKHHRKFYALLSVVFKAQSHFVTLDHMLAVIKKAVGYCDEVKHRGQTIYVPKSISFAKMPQESFETFYDAVVNFILAEILPRVNKAELEIAVNDIIEGIKS